VLLLCYIITLLQPKAFSIGDTLSCILCFLDAQSF